MEGEHSSVRAGEAAADPQQSSPPRIAEETTLVRVRNWLIRHPGLSGWAFATVFIATLLALSADPEYRLETLIGGLLACGTAFGVAGLLGLAISKSAQRAHAERIEREAAAERAIAEAERQRRGQLREFLLHPLQMIDVPALVLKKNEHCFGKWPAEAFTMRKRTQYVGGSSGVSFRVARGVYLRNSGFRGTPISTQEMTSAGSGTAYLTNVRVLFVGDATTIEIPFTKIASTEPYTDGMRFNIANKPPIILATGNNWLPLYFHRVQEGIFEGLSEDALPEELREDSSGMGVQVKKSDAPQALSASPPPFARISVTMQGDPEKITAALIQMQNGFQRELDIRADDFQAIHRLSAKIDPSVTGAAALATVRSITEGLSAALTKLQAAALRSPSMDGTIRAATTAFASFLESLLSLERESYEAPLPEEFAHTRSSILSLCRHILDQCEGWPALLNEECERLGKRNECAITLQFDVDVASVARAVDEDAKSILLRTRQY